jgi:hypothetical protein
MCRCSETITRTFVNNARHHMQVSMYCLEIPNGIQGPQTTEALTFFEEPANSHTLSTPAVKRQPSDLL